MWRLKTPREYETLRDWNTVFCWTAMIMNPDTFLVIHYFKKSIVAYRYLLGKLFEYVEYCD